MMKTYDFALKFDLADSAQDPAEYVERLYEAGCDDATVGVGQVGRLALDFSRESVSAVEAVKSAIEQVMAAVPGATLVEATPDFVGMTDIADIVGCSRQNVRKLVATNRTVFPAPVHEGTVALWHLAKVLRWFKTRGAYDVDEALMEVSTVNMQVNLARELKDVDPDLQRRFSVVA